MSLKAEDPKAGITALFPKGAGAKPEEGEAPPSAFHEPESNMSGALAKIAPAGPNLPRRTGMREIFTGPVKWAELAGETCAGCASLGPATSLPAVAARAAAPARPSLGLRHMPRWQ